MEIAKGKGEGKVIENGKGKGEEKGSGKENGKLEWKRGRGNVRVRGREEKSNI